MLRAKLRQLIEKHCRETRARRKAATRRFPGNPQAVEILEDRALLTVTSSFDSGTGTLLIETNAADNVTVTATGGNVKVNGIDPGQVVPAASVSQVNVQSQGNFRNVIDLSGMQPSDFTGIRQNSIDAGGGDDTVIGSSLSDAILAGAGDDILRGGAGNDRYEFLAFADLGSDTVDESSAASGAGTDELVFVTETGGIQIDLRSSALQAVHSRIALTLTAPLEIENVGGSQFADSIIGNSADNWLDGGDGADVVSGLAGNDLLTGFGTGTKLIGGADDDVYDLFDFGFNLGTVAIDETGGGSDAINFHQFTSGVTFNAGDFSSQSVHSNLSLSIMPGSTLESISGGEGPDTLQAAPAVDTTLRGLMGDDTLIGDTGNDTLEIDEGLDVLRGNAGNDTYRVRPFINPPGADVIDESSGSGVDIFDASDYDNLDATGVTVDLDSTSSQAYFGSRAAFSFAGQIESFVGSAFADTVDVLPLASVTRNITGDDPTAVPGDVLNVDVMSNSFTHTPGAGGTGIIDVSLAGGNALINYNSIETINIQNPPASNPSVVYVDDTFATQGLGFGTPITDADPNTSGNQPATFGIDAFATIMDGVIAVAGGGTVNVVDGTYAENVAIVRPLTLRGTSGTPSDVMILPAAGVGVSVGPGADNVTLSNILIDGGSHGIHATGVSELGLNGVLSENNSRDGLRGESLSGTLTIVSSAFGSNLGDGIQLLSVEDVNFTGVAATGNRSGVAIREAQSFTDKDGNYSNNADGGVGLSDLSGNASFTRTRLSDNDSNLDGIGNGLTVVDGSDADSVGIVGDLSLLGTTIGDTDGVGGIANQHDGAFVDAIGGHATVGQSNGPTIDTIVEGNANDGLVILGASSVTVNGGRFDQQRGSGVANQGAGLRLGNVSGSVEIEGASFDGNAARGFAVVNSVDLQLTDLTTLNNPKAGSLALVTNVTFNASTGGAVDVVAATDSLLTHTRDGLGQNDLEYTGIASLTINSAGGTDTVTVTTSPTMAYSLDGGDPSSNPGDELIVRVTGAPTDTGTVIQDAPNRDIAYQNFETKSFVNPNATIVINGSGQNDRLAISATNANSGQYQLITNVDGAGGQQPVTSPLVSFAGITSFEWESGVGDDHLEIAHTTNQVFRPSGMTTFQAGLGDDRLSISGGSANSIGYRYVSPQTGLHLAPIEIDQFAAIATSGVLHIEDRVTTVTRSFGFESAVQRGHNHSPVFSDNSVAADDVSQLSFDRTGTYLSVGPTVEFLNPTASLNADMFVQPGTLSPSSDRIQLAGLDSHFDANVSITSEGSFLASNETSIGAGAFYIMADDITLDGELKGYSAIIISTPGNGLRPIRETSIRLNDGAKINAGGGPVTIESHLGTLMEQGATINGSSSAPVALISSNGHIQIAEIVNEFGSVIVAAAGRNYVSTPQDSEFSAIPRGMEKPLITSAFAGIDNVNIIAKGAHFDATGSISEFGGTITLNVENVAASAGEGLSLFSDYSLTLGIHGQTLVGNGISAGGQIHIQAGQALTVAQPVISGNTKPVRAIYLKSTQEVQIEKGADIVSESGDILISAGDGLRVSSDTEISTEKSNSASLRKGKIELIIGIEDSATSGSFNGSLLADKIYLVGDGLENSFTIEPGKNDRVESRLIEIDGRDGADSIHIDVGQIDPLLGTTQIIVSDTGNSGTDVLSLSGTDESETWRMKPSGTSAIDEVHRQVNDPSGTPVVRSTLTTKISALEDVRIRTFGGRDNVEVQPSTNSVYRLWGGTTGTRPGDNILIEAPGSVATLDSIGLTTTGNFRPAYAYEFEAIHLKGVSHFSTVGGGGKDVFGLSAPINEPGETVFTGRIQQPNGDGGFSATEFTEFEVQVNKDAPVTIDGGGGSDLIEFWGSDAADNLLFENGELDFNGRTLELNGINNISADLGEGYDEVKIVGTHDGGPLVTDLHQQVISDENIRIQHTDVELLTIQPSDSELPVSVKNPSGQRLDFTPIGPARALLRDGSEIGVQIDHNHRSVRPAYLFEDTIAVQIDNNHRVGIPTGVRVIGSPNDDTFNVTDSRVELVGALPLELQNTTSIQLDGAAGNDTFNVTPSFKSDFEIKGGTFAGAGDVINVVATTNSVVRHAGSTSDSGVFEIEGLRPISFASIERTKLPNRPIGLPVDGKQDATPELRWELVADVASYSVELVNLTTGNESVFNVTEGASFKTESALVMGRYSFRVQGLYEDGSLTEYSEPVLFEVRPQTTIQADRHSFTARPQIQWSAVEGANRYDLWIDNRTTGESQVIREEFYIETHFVPDDDMPIGWYTVWVKPYGENNFEGSWVGHSLRIAAPTEIIGPNRGLFGGSTTFEWEPVEGAVNYDLWVRQLSPVRQDQIIRAESVSGTSFDSSTPLPEGEFIFWVQAQGVQNFQSSWSKGVRFNTFATPIVQTPHSSNATTVSEISWTQLPNSKTHEVEVTDSVGQFVLSNSELTTNQLKPTTPFASGTEYFVRARSFDMSGTASRWSPVHRFVTPTDAVDLIAPTSGPDTAIDPGPVRFQWQTVTGAARFELWVNRQDDDGQQRLYLHDRFVRTSEFTATLPTGEYRFWVRSINTDGRNGEWSRPNAFRVG